MARVVAATRLGGSSEQNQRTQELATMDERCFAPRSVPWSGPTTGKALAACAASLAQTRGVSAALSRLTLVRAAVLSQSARHPQGHGNTTGYTPRMCGSRSRRSTAKDAVDPDSCPAERSAGNVYYSPAASRRWPCSSAAGRTSAPARHNRGAPCRQAQCGANLCLDRVRGPPLQALQC